MGKIKLIAHRGGYKESNTRENSKEAIEYAVSRDYIDGVEFDIRITKDNQIVLIHNSSIKFDHQRYSVANTNYEKLNHIYLETYQTRLNTLEEILCIIPRKKLIFLEIKNIDSKKEKDHLELIARTIRKYPSKKIVIISFYYKYLKYFGSKGYPTCFLLNRKSRFFEWKTYFRLYLTLNLNMISMDKRMIHQKNSNRILKSNKLLGIYTVDEAEEINYLFHRIGMDIIKQNQNKIYITTTNPKKIYERIQLFNEEN